MSEVVAFFDFDGTLTHGDSLLPFLRMVRGTPRFVMDIVAVSPYLAAYTLRMLRNDVAKEALLQQSIGGLSIEHLREHGAQFSKNEIPTLLREDVYARLRSHQQQGHCCVLVSASLDVYLEPWAKIAGFEYCIASSMAVSPEGLVTGKINGANCHGQEKVLRIKRLLSEIGLPARTYAYGDTSGDIPMIAMADEGYWVKDGIRPFIKFKS